MRKTTLIVLTPLMASAAAAMPLVALAVPSAPHWIAGAQVIRNEARVLVTNRGKGQTLTFTVTKLGTSISCRVGFSDVITNPLNETAGTDQMTALSAD